MEWVALVDEDGAVVPILKAAPPADTGQPAVPVRVISSLAGGGGGGVVQQGARDATVQTWFVGFNGAAQPVADGGASLTVDPNIGSVFPVSDGGASLTVDAAVGSPAFVRLSDGTAALIGQKLMAASLPVVLASDHSLIKAREDTAAMTWVSAVTTASAAAAVIADTGALAAGDYDFDVRIAGGGVVAAGKVLLLEHRNAANGATLQTLAMVGATEPLALTLRRYTLALNERLRVIVGAVAFAAAERAQAAIGRRLS
ncbi:MAG TPA: hypothetical protein VGJ25_10085 [Gaiellaceae bacterium]